MKIEKGKPIPFTTDEKVILAVKEAARQNEEWKTCATWVTDLSITKANTQPISENQERVIAEGECSLGFRCLKRDAILNPKRVYFTVQAVDSKDEWGLQDVKLESFEFKQL